MTDKQRNYVSDNRKGILACLIGTLLGAVAGGLLSMSYGIAFTGFLSFGAVAGLMATLAILAARYFAK